MTTIDWIILVGTLGFIVGYGAWKNRKNESITDYLKGGNSARWWTIGLSVMATQASAITFLSTPGQAFHMLERLSLSRNPELDKPHFGSSGV